jgi:thioredoxin-related protein
MLVFVMTNGCPYCQKMMESTYQNSGVAADFSQTFVLTVVNGSEQRALARRFGVRIYPTTLLIDANNRTIDRIEGYVPADKLRQRLALATRKTSSRSRLPGA